MELCQCNMAAWMRREFGREWTCICKAESLCCAPETITTLLIGCTPVKSKKLKWKQRKMSFFITAEAPDYPSQPILPSSIKREFLHGHTSSSQLAVAMWLSSGLWNGKRKVTWLFLGSFLKVQLRNALDSHLIHLFLLDFRWRNS